MERRRAAASRAPRRPSTRRLCSITTSSGASERKPATGAGTRRAPAALDDDDPATDLGEPGHRARHVLVCHPDDDDVVRVVRDGRGEPATLEPRARDEAEPIRPVPRWRSMTAIFARSRSVGNACRPARLLDERLGDDLILDSPITRATAGPRDLEVGGENGLIRTLCVTQSGTSAADLRLERRPRLSTISGTNARGRAGGAGRPGSRARSHRDGRARATAPGWSEAITSASSGGTP